jgi:Fe-S cluster biosynthesis and repair protein YggX
MNERRITCKKLGKELKGLDKPPFPGPLGKRIFDEISEEAWAQWKDLQIKIINEYRLNLADKKDYDVLLNQMMLFLGFAEGEVKEVENANRGRGEWSKV